ncbi:MAG: hypothetical protein WBB62_10920 [Rhodococcus sp. (in: high G+C Gram-positive bacteria)]
MTTNGFGKYLGDDHRVAATLRAKKAQLERDERKRAHEVEMFAKRSKREAAGEGSPSGRAARTAEQRQQDDATRARLGSGFGRYLLPRE